MNTATVLVGRNNFKKFRLYFNYTSTGYFYLYMYLALYVSSGMAEVTVYLS